MPLTAEHLAALAAPFAKEAIEVKPGATTKDKTKALALPYADSRAYQERLDALGLEWHTTYQPLFDNAVICTLSINGVTRSDVGEGAINDPNRATIAAAQAFKRACAAFGLGRYLYALEKVWGQYDDQKKCFLFPDRIIDHLYKKAGLK